MRSGISVLRPVRGLHVARTQLQARCTLQLPNEVMRSWWAAMCGCFMKAWPAAVLVCRPCRLERLLAFS